MYEDFYLAFQDEAEARSVLYTVTPETTVVDENTGEEVIVEEQVTPNYQNIDILGTVYEPAPEPTPEDYEPVPYPAPNYGVNVRLVPGEDAAALQPYAVTPAPFPQRVWA
jgi:hypothetical protein